MRIDIYMKQNGYINEKVLKIIKKSSDEDNIDEYYKYNNNVKREFTKEEIDIYNEICGLTSNLHELEDKSFNENDELNDNVKENDELNDNVNENDELNDNVKEKDELNDNVKENDEIDDYFINESSNDNIKSENNGKKLSADGELDGIEANNDESSESSEEEEEDYGIDENGKPYSRFTRIMPDGLPYWKNGIPDHKYDWNNICHGCSGRLKRLDDFIYRGPLFKVIDLERKKVFECFKHIIKNYNEYFVTKKTIDTVDLVNSWTNSAEFYEGFSEYIDNVKYQEKIHIFQNEDNNLGHIFYCTLYRKRIFFSRYILYF